MADSTERRKKIENILQKKRGDAVPNKDRTPGAGTSIELAGEAKATGRWAKKKREGGKRAPARHNTKRPTRRKTEKGLAKASST